MNIISHMDKFFIISYKAPMESLDGCNCNADAMVNDYCCEIGNGSNLCCNIEGIGDPRIRTGNSRSQTKLLSTMDYTFSM